jgi:crotonobetainyl-CoA:carnitine CoA-transferase CaiB-like acyl-CoA transferase
VVQVFDGLKVLDFTWGMAGSMATMVLSDFGAEVIKVEPPDGDPFRSWPASFMWNRGKKNIVLDLKSPQGRFHALEIAQEVDVVVVSFRPGVVERLGIDFETLSAKRPDLVYCSLTGFGPKGRYAFCKGYEGVVAARAGWFMHFAGQANREGPHYASVNVASHAAAMAVVRGITAALYVRDRTGQGQKLETSLLQAITAYDYRDWILWQMMMKDPERFPEDPWVNPRRLPNPGYVAARTKDGQWLQMANILKRPFRAWIHALELDSLFDDPRFASAPMLMPEEHDLLREMVLKRIQEKSLDEWMHIFTRRTNHVAAEPFLTTTEAMQHPQVVHNGHVQNVEDPRLGMTQQLGPLAVLAETPGSIKGPTSELGQHTQDVLGQFLGGHTVHERGSQPLPAHPLEGITVLDHTTVLAGPLGCSLLAELGARVIRIETPEGDWIRENHYGIATQRTMAGTEGMCIDLKTPEGQEFIHKLLARADVLVHNMRDGTPERLGIGYEQALRTNPRLIYLYAAAYGSSGPYYQRPAMHPIAGAVCGGALTQAGRGAVSSPEKPLTLEEIKETSRMLGRANESNPDENTSMVISTAVLLALYSRERTGKGQYVETSMLGANAYANADDFFAYQGRPPRLLPDAQGYGPHPLYRLYRARQGWVFLACPREGEWQALCRTIGRNDWLTDPRFDTSEARWVNENVLVNEIQAVFLTRDSQEWEELLAQNDIACVQAEERGPYHFFAEDSHILDNGFTTEVTSDRFGTVWRYGPLINFLRTPGRTGPGPLKGQHTQSILRELGYSEKRIRELKARGIVDWEDE